MERIKMNFELGEQEHKRFIKTLEREKCLVVSDGLLWSIGRYKGFSYSYKVILTTEIDGELEADDWYTDDLYGFVVDGTVDFYVLFEKGKPITNKEIVDSVKALITGKDFNFTSNIIIELLNNYEIIDERQYDEGYSYIVDGYIKVKSIIEIENRYFLIEWEFDSHNEEERYFPPVRPIEVEIFYKKEWKYKGDDE